MKKLGLVCAMIAFTASSASATVNRFWLATQQNAAANRGFILSLNNETPGNGACKLSTLNLVLGTGNGRAWRTDRINPGWQIGHSYRVKVVLGPAGAKLWLDGKLVAEQSGPYVPDARAMNVHATEYGAGPTDYYIEQTTARLNSGRKIRALAFPATLPVKPEVLLFRTWMAGTNVDFTCPADRPFTFETTFYLKTLPDVRSVSPMIDRYGQAVAADFPGKVKTDADIKRAQAEEDRRLKAWDAPAGFDRYGGWTNAGWKERSTGYFHTTKHGGKWWLVSPEGNPCFYVGLCSVPTLNWEMTPVTGREWLFEWLPPKIGDYAACWSANVWGQDPGIEYVALHTPNLIRKFGKDWQAKAKELTARRIRAWGFSGISKWCFEVLPNLSYMWVMSRDRVPSIAGHPDVFDPQIRKAFREDLRRQIEPHRSDPFLVGWSLGNEWPESVKKAEVQSLLKQPGTVPVKRALCDYAFKALYHGEMAKLASAWGVSAAALEALYDTQPSPPAKDVEELRRFYSRAYYRFVYTTVKELDPNHLYFGYWIMPGWWEDESDWRLIAENCDVVGYDRYSDDVADPQFSRLLRQTDKPVFCGEASFPPTYRGARGYGQYGAWAEDDAQAGAKFARLLSQAAANPYCVGYSWFEYRDEPVSGRGPGHGEGAGFGEYYAFGLVDVTDRPKWDLVERVRQANLLARKSRK